MSKRYVDLNLNSCLISYLFRFQRKMWGRNEQKKCGIIFNRHFDWNKNRRGNQITLYQNRGIFFSESKKKSGKRWNMRTQGYSKEKEKGKRVMTLNARKSRKYWRVQQKKKRKIQYFFCLVVTSRNKFRSLFFPSFLVQQPPFLFQNWK